MEQQHVQRNNGLGSGFLLGVVVGVIITLLFTTKKGRELVKEMTDKGLERFSDLQEMLDRTEDELQEDAFYDYPEEPKEEKTAKPIHIAEKTKEVAPPQEEKVEGKETEKEEKTTKEPEEEQKKESVEPEAPKKSPVRKFFRIKKS